MARIVPGSGAVIKPIFNETFGVRAVEVLDGGSGYDSTDPPRLTVTGCGTPVTEALLYPIIDDDSGRIVHVRVLASGEGYDPLRLSLLPLQDTPTIVTSFDIRRIWQSSANSITSSAYQRLGQQITDRLVIRSDNHPKPADIAGERVPGGGSLIDRQFNQTFIYRGGKDVPFFGARSDQFNKATGILANGVLLHTPEWGPAGNPPAGFAIDVVKYPFIKGLDQYGGAVDNDVYYYHSSKVINHFSLPNGVFENGNLQTFVWGIKVEFDNVLLPISNLDESLGDIEVGRIVEKIGGGGAGTIAKIVRDGQNNVTRVYLRLVSGSFEENDLLLGTNGFVLTVGDDPILFPNGIFYINFGPDAQEFGDFIPNEWYFSPENIRVQRNYQIIWDSSHPSNQPSEMHTGGHPMQFSTTADGLLNNGDLYYNSTGTSNAMSVDYQDEFAPTFIMNADESNRIYYYCKYHRYMSGYVGDEGYMILDPELPSEEPRNTYYIRDYWFSNGIIDYSRHANGHSKILGMSFDGYPIYGPWGYNTSGSAVRMTSSFRLKTVDEREGNRPTVTTPGTVTYTVTYANSKLAIDGNVPAFLSLERGKTYVFNQDDASNNSQYLLFSEVNGGWHVGNPPSIGDTNYLYTNGITYTLDGVNVTYQNYISGFNTATERRLTITPRVDSPSLLYVIAYTQADAGFRTVQTGYLLGDLVSDYIYDSAVGTLDEFNGKFAVTPEYPNGTYAYFMTEDGNGDPVYPYVIGPKYYGAPVFEGQELEAPSIQYPSGAEGEVILNDQGEVSYIKMTKNGDGYFGPTQAKILGGQGSGATGSATVQSITGLALLNPGRSFATPPTLIFEGGGGQGATGSASIDTAGKLTGITIVNPGEFYQTPPYVYITGGGGLGAKAVARIDQGSIVGIDITDPGTGYINPPQIIFTKLVNLKRKASNRQSYNSTQGVMTGLLKNATASDGTIYVSSTDAFPGSGRFILNGETISYASKSRERFTGLTRGLNFNYDQRIVLDNTQLDANGNSTYEFSVGDRVIRRIENANNKVAKVYDWNPANRELLVTFEVDELAFIDAGVPGTEDATIQFDAGIFDSAAQGQNPHVVLTSVGSTIVTLTTPIGVLQDRAFEDNDENEDPNNPGTFLGDGIPDLVNAGTDYENQISLDGGIYNSLYGIEETVGGQNTTLFQPGDQIKDASLPFKFATIIEAGQLNEGKPQLAEIEITLDGNFGNGQNYSVNEIVTGAISGVRATVTSWSPITGKLRVKDVTPYDTGNINIGIAGLLYSFSVNSTIVDFIVKNPGADYSIVPTLNIENVGDIAATTTVVMTSAGDQIDSISISNGGYGYKKYVDNTYATRPTVTVVTDPSDPTGSGGVVEPIIGGEYLNGNGGASYRIKSIEYLTVIRSE